MQQVLPSIEAAIPRTEEEQYEYIVVAVKALPSIISSLIHSIEPIVTTGTSIVLLQNGLDIESPFAEQFPHTPVLSGVSLIGSRLTGRNSVYHEDPDVLKIGAYFHHEESLPQAVQLKATQDFIGLYAAGLHDGLNSYAKCIFVPDIASARWRKLLYNATFNTICALLRISVGELLSNPYGRDRLLEPAMREIAAIASAAGYGDVVDEAAVQDTLHGTPETSPFRPSMLQDMEAGRPMEVAVILGAPLKVGSEKGVETPLLSRLYDLLSVVQWTIEVGFK